LLLINQVANLELSCLHPFHPAVAETLQSLYRMLLILQQAGRAIQVLRVLAIREETIYGVVSPQNAHASWLVADAYLRHSTSVKKSDQYTNEDAYTDAKLASDWAQKALQIMSVLYGRNHELTYATHVTLDLALFCIEREEKIQEVKKEEEITRAEELARRLTCDYIASEDSSTGKEHCEHLEHSDQVQPSAPKSEAQECAIEDCSNDAKLLCPTCATIFTIPFGKRIQACENCGHFCTHVNLFRGLKPSDKLDPFGIMLDGIIEDFNASSPNMHVAGEMLPTTRASFSAKGLSNTRANTNSIEFYDANMRDVISKISDRHQHEWQPCTLCSKPRAAKQ
jgi:hypothetical protein